MPLKNSLWPFPTESDYAGQSAATRPDAELRNGVYETTCENAVVVARIRRGRHVAVAASTSPRARRTHPLGRARGGCADPTSRQPIASRNGHGTGVFVGYFVARQRVRYPAAVVTPSAHPSRSDGGPSGHRLFRLVSTTPLTYGEAYGILAGMFVIQPTSPISVDVCAVGVTTADVGNDERRRATTSSCRTAGSARFSVCRHTQGIAGRTDMRASK